MPVLITNVAVRQAQLVDCAQCDFEVECVSHLANGEGFARCRLWTGREWGDSFDCDVKAGDAKEGDEKAAAADTFYVSSSAKTSKTKSSARELLAKNLVRLRHERQWSQEALAHEAGLHRTFVAHVERCGRNISLDNLEKLAHALQVPTVRLLDEDAE